MSVPPHPVQEQQVAVVGAINQKIRLEEASIDKLRQLRAGLAADLLSGRVRTVGV